MIDRYGRPQWDEVGGLRVAASPRDPKMKGLSLFFDLPTPLGPLFPPAGPGADFVQALGHIAALRRQAVGDRNNALREARTAAGPYVGEAETPVYWRRFVPALYHDGLDRAFHVGAAYNLRIPEADARTANTLAQILTTNEWQEVLLLELWAATCTVIIPLGSPS